MNWAWSSYIPLAILFHVDNVTWLISFDFSNVYDFRHSIEHMSMNGGRQLCKSFSSLLSAILMNETTSCWIKKTYQNLKWDFSSDRDDITIFHLLSRSTIKVQRIILYLVPQNLFQQLRYENELNQYERGLQLPLGRNFYPFIYCNGAINSRGH